MIIQWRGGEEVTTSRPGSIAPPFLDSLLPLYFEQHSRGVSLSPLVISFKFLTQKWLTRFRESRGYTIIISLPLYTLGGGGRRKIEEVVAVWKGRTEYWLLGAAHGYYGNQSALHRHMLLLNTLHLHLFLSNFLSRSLSHPLSLRASPLHHFIPHYSILLLKTQPCYLVPHWIQYIARTRTGYILL